MRKKTTKPPAHKNDCGSPFDDCISCDALKGCMHFAEPYFIDYWRKLRHWVDLRGGEGELRAAIIFKLKKDTPMFSLTLICHHMGISVAYYNKLKIIHNRDWQEWFMDNFNEKNMSAATTPNPCYLVTFPKNPGFSNFEKKEEIMNKVI